MPSFDIITKADLSSVRNGVYGVQKEIKNRYDFKGSQSKVEFMGSNIFLYCKLLIRCILFFHVQHSYSHMLDLIFV